MSDGKAMIISLNLKFHSIEIPLKLISLYKMSQYFPKRFEPFGGDLSVKLNLLK